MKYEIVKRDRRGETTTIDEGSCDTREEAMETFIDCIIDHGKDDYWLMQDYSRIKAGRNNILYRQKLAQLAKNGQIEEAFVGRSHRYDGYGYEYELLLRVSGEEKEQYDDDLFLESWDPSYYDKPENQYGEKWMHITGTYINGAIEDIIKDVQIDPYQDGPKLESLSLSCLNLCDDGHLVAEFYGGANGGGFRGEDCNWKFYLSLIRKFLGKLLDYDRGDFFNDVWLIDWSNDCCDDCWTLTLGLELSDSQKYHLVECIKHFPVLDLTKFNIGIDAAMDIVDPTGVAQMQAAGAIPVTNVETTISESSKWRKIAK